MIPTINTILNNEFEMEQQPSKNYKIHFNEQIIHGFRGELEAMKQVVYKILNTERYRYLIYSKYYGIELENLFGEPVSYVCPELERRITEALVQDDRVKSVDSFYFDISKKRTVHVTFVVRTIFGDVNAQKAVNY